MCEAADGENRTTSESAARFAADALRKKKRDRTRLKILLIELAANLTKVTEGIARIYGYLPRCKKLAVSALIPISGLQM
jgi:hypothetical protein